MEGVVVEARVRAPCKRFPIKGNGICDCLQVVLTATRLSFTAFFPLRTIRVVTRISANLRRIPSGWPTSQTGLRRHAAFVVSTLLSFRPYNSPLISWSRLITPTQKRLNRQRVLPAWLFVKAARFRRGPAHKRRTDMEPLNSPPSARQRACRLS